MKSAYTSLVHQADQLKAKHYKETVLDAARYAIIMLSIAYLVGLHLKNSPSVSSALQHPILNVLHLVFSVFEDGLRFSNDYYATLVGVFCLLSLSNILSVGQSQFYLRLIRDQKACLIEATTYGFTQYRWVYAIVLTCIEMLVAYLGCVASLLVIMCIGPGWTLLQGLTHSCVCLAIVAVMFIPYFYVSTLSYHTYYLMADKNIKGLALFENAHAITKSVGFVKTGLLRFRHGIYLVLMLAIAYGFTHIVHDPIGSSDLGYAARFIFTALPIFVIAPYKSAMNTILYEHHKEVHIEK